MEIFERNSISASINLNGLAIEMWPDSVKPLHAAAIIDCSTR